MAYVNNKTKKSYPDYNVYLKEQDFTEKDNLLSKPSNTSASPTDLLNKGVVKKGETLSGIIQSLKTTPEEFLKANPSFAGKGDKTDYMGLTGNIYEGQKYTIPGEATPVAPTPGSGTYIEDLANSLDSKGGSEDATIATSDAIRAKQKKDEIEQIKKDLTGGAERPDIYKSAEEYKKLREEQGIVDDEGELSAIQNEAALINQELRKYRSTAGEAVPEAGRIGAVSEAERNAMFRLEDLSIREQAVLSRINAKNAYISNMLKLGQQDYINALNDYNTEFAKNLKAVELYNEGESQLKKDAIASLTTITNLVTDKGITWDSLDANTKSQIETLSLQAGLPSNLIEQSLSIAPEDKIQTIASRTDANGNEYFDILKARPDGSLYVDKVYRGPGGGLGGVNLGGFTPTPVTDAMTSAFNSSVLGLPVASQKVARQTFQNYLAKGDVEGAKNYLLSMTVQGLPADQQNQMVGRAVATDTLKQIGQLLEKARNTKGVNTNWFTGNLEYTANKLGTSTNPDLAYIGSLLQQQFITYRRAMTGVAFSPEESKDYKKIFPSLIDVEKLSTAKLQALQDTFQMHNRANLALYLGGTQNYDAIYGGLDLSLPSQQVSPESQMTLDALWNESGGDRDTKEINLGVGDAIKSGLKSFWSWVTTPFK